jgi:hypothetical protein
VFNVLQNIVVPLGIRQPGPGPGSGQTRRRAQVYTSLRYMPCQNFLGFPDSDVPVYVPGYTFASGLNFIPVQTRSSIGKLEVELVCTSLSMNWYVRIYWFSGSSTG